MTDNNKALEERLRQDLGLQEWQIGDLLPIITQQCAEARIDELYELHKELRESNHWDIASQEGLTWDVMTAINKRRAALTSNQPKAGDER